MNLKPWLVLLALPALVQAVDVRVSGSNHAEYWVFVDPSLDSLNYKEHLENKLKLAVNAGDVTLKGVFFLWQPSLPNPGKLTYLDYTAQYNREPINLLFGRYYTTFGRGLVLNAFLDEDFRNDNSLYGLKTDFQYLKSRVTLVAGKPRNIFFEQNEYFIKNDTTDQIKGINLETDLIPHLNLGGRYVRVNRKVDLTPKAFTELFGGSIGAMIGPWDGYFEYGRLWGSHPAIGGRLQGTGILLTTSLSLTGFGLSLQYMDYDTIGFGGAGYRYNEPPTPIKSGISVNRGIDERGFGGTLAVTPISLLTGEISYNQIKTHDGRSGVIESVTKLTGRPSERIEIIGGLEYLLKDKIELPIDRKTELKPNIELTYDLGPVFIETGYEHTFITSDTSSYYDHSLSFSVGKPELFVLSLRYERRNRVPAWLVDKLGTETNWPLAELSLDLTNRHNLRIRVGGEKGGLVCSGGVCRFEEPFRGVKLVFTSIF